MTDIRDLILNDDSGDEQEKSVEKQKTVSDAAEHIKVAEQLEALSEEDTLVDDLIKVALFNEAVEILETKGGEDDN